MTVINFFLTRHGETQWNKIGKFQGQFDSPLTEKGCQQAHAIAAQLIDNNINLIVSSTLPRAKKTADICQTALNCPLSLKSTLIERNFGGWQGKCIRDVKSDHNYHAIFHQVNTFSPPNGESGIDCAERFQQALKDIAKTYQPICSINHNENEHITPQYQTAPNELEKSIHNILVVSHGDILRCFISTNVENFSDEQAISTHNKAFDNGCIFKLNYDIEKQQFTLLSTIDITKYSLTKVAR
jgi:broad specificity phosphatase PhoE